MIPCLDGICKSSNDDYGYCITSDGKSVSARTWAMPADSAKTRFNIFYMENKFLRDNRVYMKVAEDIPASCVDSYMVGILTKRITKGKKPLAYEVAEVGEQWLKI